MSDSPLRGARDAAKPCPSTEAPSLPAQPSASTISSFQILPLELPAHPNTSPHTLDFQALLGLKIDPLHRLKLLKWLLAETATQNYYREVFAYAAHYLDRFLALAEPVPLADLQVVAFGALLLATKVEGAAFPRLGRMFDINDILAAEERIALRLNYFLHPRTYVHHLTDLIAEWDRFADSEQLYEGQRYLGQSLTGFQRHRAMYERMECVYMAPQSHRFPVHTLALNLFFLQNKANIEALPAQERPTDTLLDFIRDSYKNEEGYGCIFQQFMTGMERCEGALEVECGLYLASFICLPVGVDAPNRRCINYHSYLRMQTTTEDAMAALTRLAKTRRQAH